MVRIVCISDTHNRLNEIDVPDGDILIHSGDATSRGTEKEIAQFNEDLGKLNFEHIIFCGGNHDFLLERDESLARNILTNCITLINESIQIKGINFYGSPITKWFHSWAFNVPSGNAIKKYWDMIPNNTDVLITHGPPHMILDVVPEFLGDRHEGCEELVKAVDRVKPIAHIFGHLHENGGQSKKIGDTLFINAAIMNEAYIPANKPIVFDI